MKNITLGIVALTIAFLGYWYFGMYSENKADMIVEKNTEMTFGVKEFNMDSWMEMKDGKMGAFFSLKEIKVKKGDKVKINIKNTKGTHDFVIDEFGIKQDTPEGAVTTIEFVADKVGTFEYYCSKYSHRTMGQTGKLIVE